MPRNGSNGTRVGLDREAVLRAYRRWAPTYDLFFGPVFQRGRAAAAERINALDCRRVLEVGVGTGLSLPLYRRDKEITGVDVCPEMLSHASERASRLGLEHVVEIAEMDAETLRFGDGRFDAVVACYVMSVVPDPRRCLAEMARVCRPGGTILVCNHFVNGSGGFVSSRLQPFSRWLGWRPSFRLEDMLADSPLSIEHEQVVQPFGLFHLVTLRKADDPPA